MLSPEDRSQSRGKYFPFGEDRYNPNPANPTNDQEKFATYTRDSAIGLKYAYQRYYNSQLGRFQTLDPYPPSGKPSQPQSWNKYAYAANDPIDNSDPSGLIVSLQPTRPPGLYTPFMEVLSNWDGEEWVDTYYLIYLPAFTFLGGPSMGVAGLRSAYPKCNPTNNPSVENELKFIAQNYDAAVTVAQQVNADFHLNISASTVIGWSAAEVGWTIPPNNNYFNETRGGNWVDQTGCPSGANGPWACFGSFEASAISAFFWGLYMPGYQSANSTVNNSPRRDSYLRTSSMTGALRWQAFQQVASDGKTGGFNRNDSNYGTNVANTVASTTTHVQCMQQNGYVH